MPVGSPTANAFAHAVSNERFGPSGVVSRKDARNIVKAAINEIASSTDPANDFAYNTRFISAAKSMLGRSKDAAKILNSYETKGSHAVNARLMALGLDLALPPKAKDAVAEFVGWRVDPADVTITNARKVPGGGFEFDWAHAGESGSAFVVEFDGAWIPAPIRFDPAILPDVLESARAHFDNIVVPWASDYHSPAELAEYRAGIRITDMNVNEDPDDPDKTDEGWTEGFPYEFNIDGGAPGDGGLYVGFKPENGELNGFGRWA